MSPRSGWLATAVCLAAAAPAAVVWTGLVRLTWPGAANGRAPAAEVSVLKAPVPPGDGARARLDRLAAAVLVRLDELAQLRDEVDDQKTSLAKAEAAERQARLDLEVAELAAREYDEGVAPQEAEAAEAEVALAAADARAAREGRPAPDESAALRTRLALDLARTKRDVLSRLTRARRSAELRRERSHARDEAAARRASLTQERNDLARLERLLAEAALTPDEARALAALDAASRLTDARLPAATDEAARLWALAVARRDALKSADALRRIRSALSLSPPDRPD